MVIITDITHNQSGGVETLAILMPVLIVIIVVATNVVM